VHQHVLQVFGLVLRVGADEVQPVEQGLGWEELLLLRGLEQGQDALVVYQFGDQLLFAGRYQRNQFGVVFSLPLVLLLVIKPVRDQEV